MTNETKIGPPPLRHALKCKTVCVAWFLDYMVVHLGLRTHVLLHVEIGNIIAEILSAWEKAECYKEVANHSQGFFTVIQDNNFWVF